MRGKENASRWSNIFFSLIGLFSNTSTYTISSGAKPRFKSCITIVTRMNYIFSSFWIGPIRQKLTLYIMHYALHDRYINSCRHRLEIEYILDMAQIPQNDLPWMYKITKFTRPQLARHKQRVHNFLELYTIRIRIRHAHIISILF